MTIAGAIAMTALVLTVAAVVAAAVASGQRHPSDHEVWMEGATALAIVAAVLYVAAIWTHTLT